MNGDLIKYFDKLKPADWDQEVKLLLVEVGVILERHRKQKDHSSKTKAPPTPKLDICPSLGLEN